MRGEFSLSQVLNITRMEVALIHCTVEAGNGRFISRLHAKGKGDGWIALMFAMMPERRKPDKFC